MENALGEPQTIVLLGGTSDIGRAIVDRAAVAGDAHRRAGRPATRTRCAVGELERPGRRRSTPCTSTPPTPPPTRRSCATSSPATATSTSSIVAFGQLVEQAELDADPAAGGRRWCTVNYTGAVSVGLAVAAQFRRQGHGRLVVLSSVAVALAPELGGDASDTLTAPV